MCLKYNCLPGECHDCPWYNHLCISMKVQLVLRYCYIACATLLLYDDGFKCRFVHRIPKVGILCVMENIYQAECAETC